MNTEAVSTFIRNAELNSFPDEVIAHAKLAILDTLGVSLAARQIRARSAGIVEKLVVEMGGQDEATLLWSGFKAPAPLAALANSVLASACDMDDGVMGSEGHLGHIAGMVVPAALCVAESRRASGKAFLEAVVAGYEIAVRTGSILVGMLGIQTCGTVGSYGVAASAAKLLDLGIEETGNCLSIVEGHTMAGIRNIDIGALLGLGGFERWGMIKESMGWGSIIGVIAALLARHGFTGHYSLYDRSDIDHALLGDLGKKYRIGQNYFKCHSSCRNTHATIDGVLDLVTAHGLRADDIDKVIVESNSILTLFNVHQPAGIEQAQYSIPFLVGAAILEGAVTPEQVNEERLSDRAILKIADRVEIRVNPEIEAQPIKFGSVGTIVKITTRDDLTYETRVDIPRGDFHKPLSADALKGKFRSLSHGVLGTEQSEKVIDCIEQLEKINSIEELILLVVP